MGRLARGQEPIDARTSITIRAGIRCSESTMSKPLVVSIPHRLGKDEALRRLKNGLGSASANFGHVFKIQEEI
jgi:hypothetical protein